MHAHIIVEYLLQYLEYFVDFEVFAIVRLC